MTIASEITRINTNIASAYTACNNKGATMPATQNSANLANCINSISSGTTPSGTLSITSNGTYNVTNYASANVHVLSGGSGTITLYAWDNSSFYCYTTSSTPSYGSAIYEIKNGKLQLSSDTVMIADFDPEERIVCLQGLRSIYAHRDSSADITIS